MSELKVAVDPHRGDAEPFDCSFELIDGFDVPEEILEEPRRHERSAAMEHQLVEPGDRQENATAIDDYELQALIEVPLLGEPY